MENKIYYNDPSKAKERQKVKPLSVADVHNAVTSINIMLKSLTYNPFPVEIESIQNLLFDYENLCHLRSYTGGWIDVNKQKPEIGIEVLVLGEKGEVFIAEYDAMPDFVAIGFIGDSTGYFTHWRPLPQNP